jgi:hypothetical protein
MADQIQERVATKVVTEAGAANAVSTTEVIVADNPNRVCVMIQPTDGDIYIRFGATVTTANGIKVTSGSLFEERDYTGQIAAIASAGTVDVRIIEVG